MENILEWSPSRPGNNWTSLARVQSKEQKLEGYLTIEEPFKTNRM